MTAKTKAQNKSNFQSGDIPSENDFVDLIDSFPDIVTPSVIDNLVTFATITGEQKDSGSKVSDFAIAAKGVTNGDAHDHVGGDGAQINHTTLLNIGTHTHPQIDIHINLDDPDSPPTAGDNPSTVLSYTGDDVTQIVKTIGGIPYTTDLAYTYDIDGNITQLQKTMNAITYTKTFTWVAGKLTAVSAWS